MKCPNCGGQLKLSYDQTMMVQCDSCESTFTIDDISRHINSIKYGTRINNDDIYEKEKFNEALTTKNICNLKDEALDLLHNLDLLIIECNDGLMQESTGHAYLDKVKEVTSIITPKKVLLIQSLKFIF